MCVNVAFVASSVKKPACARSFSARGRLDAMPKKLISKLLLRGPRLLDEKMDRWVYLNDLNEKIQDAKQQG